MISTVMRKLLFFSFIAALVFGLEQASPVRAGDPIQVDLAVPSQTLRVGDPIQLALSVITPAGYQVIIPRLDKAWGEFEVRSQSPVETTPNDDGTQTSRQTIEVTLFMPGTFQTPAWSISVSDAAGQVRDVQVGPAPVTITPVLAEDDTALNDIKPQADLPIPPIWPELLAGLLLATILAVVGWRIIRRLRRPDPIAVGDHRTPYQVACDELDRIAALNLAEQELFKEHYTLVTDCLRRYLEDQHHVRAFDRTTAELRLALRQSALEPEHGQRYVELFRQADLVKFAKVRPDVATARQVIDLVRDLVTLTQPSPPSINNPAAGEGTSSRNEPQSETVEVLS